MCVPSIVCTLETNVYSIGVLLYILSTEGCITYEMCVLLIHFQHGLLHLAFIYS